MVFFKTYGYLFFAGFVIIFILKGLNNHQNPRNQEKMVMNLKGFPEVFELNKGETYHLRRSSGQKIVEKNITLIDVKSYREPNYSFPESTP